jgi:hypothetical protein
MAVIWDPLDDSTPFPFDSATVCIDYRRNDDICFTVWERLKIDKTTTLFKLIERLTIILGQSAQDPSIYEINPYEISIRIMANPRRIATDKKG